MLLIFGWSIDQKKKKKKEKNFESCVWNKMREIALVISYKNSLRCEILLARGKFYTFFFMVISHGRRKHLSE